MANAMFLKGKEGLLAGEIDLDTATIKIALLRNYTPTMSSSTHKFVSDVTTAGATIVSTSPALTSKDTTNGVFNAAGTQFATVPAGAACTRILIFQASAVGGGSDVADTAQRVIALLDTAAGGAAINVAPNGGNIDIGWDTGVAKIFAL
jgi:hypothetical protein